MNFRQYVKKLMAMNPDIKAKHGMPTNRRELLAQGYIMSAGAVVMAKSSGIMGGDVAFGQEGESCSDDSGQAMKPAYFVVDLGGGANIAGANAIVGGPGGIAATDADSDFLGLDSYETIGLLAAQHPSVVTLNREFGMAFHPLSGILQGMLATTSEAARSATNGVLAASSSGDDTQNNEHYGTHWLVKAGLNGQVVSQVGNQDTISGGRAQPVAASINPAYKPIQVRNSGDARGLVTPGVLATVLGQDGAAEAFKVMRTMSDRQIEALAQQDVDTQIRNLAKKAFRCSGEQVSKFDVNLVDPEQDPLIAQDPNDIPNSGPFDFNNGDDRQGGSIAKLVLDGFAGAGVISMGGYDYHGNDRTTTDARDLRAGQMIGKLIQATVNKGRVAMIQVHTDGAVGCRGDFGDGRTNAASDSGNRSSAYCLVVDGRPGATRPEIAGGNHQLGAFRNDSGSVDNEMLATSNSPANLARWFVLQWLALQGEEGRFGSIVDQDPFGDELATYLRFGKIV